MELYLGFPLQSYGKMIRGRATNAQKRATFAATGKHYKMMASAASEVVLGNRGKPYRNGTIAHVLFVFPHWVKFDKTFPKGRIISKELITNTHKVNAIKLLDWLYKNGKCEYNASMLLSETTKFEGFLKRIDKMF